MEKSVEDEWFYSNIYLYNFVDIHIYSFICNVYLVDTFI